MAIEVVQVKDQVISFVPDVVVKVIIMGFIGVGVDLIIVAFVIIIINISLFVLKYLSYCYY